LQIYGYQRYGKDYSAYGKGTSGYGANVYNNVILPHPYPVPVPIPISGQTGSRYVVVGNGASTNNGLLGFGNGGIFGKIIICTTIAYSVCTNVTSGVRIAICRVEVVSVTTSICHAQTYRQNN
jgi:hypothetical protein